jgi:hypothetical protein
MGVVYGATDLSLGRPAALELIARCPIALDNELERGPSLEVGAERQNRVSRFR